MKSNTRTRLSIESLEARTVPAFVASMVADVNPGTNSSSPSGIIQFSGAAYFKADDGVHGFELWKTDGTAAGTGLVKDINPGSAGSLNGYYFTEMNGRLYFAANDGVHRYELWCTDGTEAGTVMVCDINLGLGSSNPYGHIVDDPTPHFERMAVINNTLYFSADDGVHGRELWRSDGIPGGSTALVADIRPASTGSLDGAQYMTVINNVMYFSPDDGAHGRELWRSDGTPAGTWLLKDINPGAAASNIAYLTHCNGTVLFRADDGSRGTELWRSDGTAAGTVLLKDIVSGSGGSSAGFPTAIVTSTGAEIAIFYVRVPYHGGTVARLWKTDGTAMGTVEINPNLSWNLLGVEGGGAAAYSVPVGNAVYFGAQNSAGTELWKSDGTVSGTIMLTDNPGTDNGKPSGFPNGTNPSGMGGAYGRLFFGGYRAATGTELWTSDGTAAGTAFLQELNPGTAGSSPGGTFEGFTSAAGTVFFMATDAAHGTELWRLDQTMGMMNGPPKLVGATVVSQDSLGAARNSVAPATPVARAVRHTVPFVIHLSEIDLRLNSAINATSDCQIFDYAHDRATDLRDETFIEDLVFFEV